MVRDQKRTDVLHIIYELLKPSETVTVVITIPTAIDYILHLHQALRKKCFKIILNLKQIYYQKLNIRSK